MGPTEPGTILSREQLLCSTVGSCACPAHQPLCHVLGTQELNLGDYSGRRERDEKGGGRPLGQKGCSSGLVGLSDGPDRRFKLPSLSFSSDYKW